MAFATVDHHLHLDSVPIVDLRLLTQSELYSLSLTSSTASHPNRRFDDDVLIPKIDRSVFNESAGSRKQTYSRLRLAPRNPQFASTNSKSALPRQAPILSQPLDQESRQIITLLKQLFPSENQNQNQNGDDLVSTPVQCESQAAPAPSLVYSSVSAGVDSSLGKRKRGRPRKDSYAVIAKTEVAVPVNSTALTGAVDEAKVGNADVFIEKRDGENTPIGTFVLSGDGKLVQSIEGKRKRGRPRKDEIRVRVESSVGVRERKARVKKEVNVEGEMVLVNINDVVVDLDALGNADSTFGEELRKRTEGLETEAQLLGFLEGLQGEWSSARKKRKIVQATELGDYLPKWWKVMLSLKRNGGHKWLVCRRYISPNGQQFVSCKEVSSFLHSYFGLGGRSNPVHTYGNIQVTNKMVLGDDANLTYEDKNHYHELVGFSPIPIVKSYVKSIEAPGQVMGMLKKLDPVRSGRFGRSLKIQESVEIDREQTSGTIASYDLISGFSQGKVNDVMKECFGTYNDELISLSYEEQAMKADKNCFSDGLNDGVRVSISSVDVPKVDVDSASNDMGKEHGADNIDNYQSTSTIEDMKIDDVDNSGNGRSTSGISESHIGPENAYSNVDQQSTSEACSLVPSNMIESLHKRGSESGLYSTATDDKTCAVSNDFNNDSFPTFCEPTFDDIGLSGSNDKTISFGRDHGMPDVDSMEISERIRSTGSCSSVPPLDGQSFIAVNNATNPSCTVEELWREKSLASNSLTSFVNKQSSDDLNKGGIQTAEGPKGDHTKNYNDSELSVSFGSRATGTNADTTSCIEQERSSKGYSLAPYANEHASVLKNNFVCNSILEELKQDRGTSETDLVCPSGCRQSYNLVNNVNSTSSRSIEESKEEVKGSWNDEELLDFNSSRGGLEVSAMTGTGNEISSQGPSLVLSEDNQTFATGSGIFSSSVLDDKLIRGSVSGLARPSSSEQTPGFVNNLNRVYSSTLWEQPTSEGAEKSRNNEPMTSFLNDSQPSADAMSELLWRIGGQNVQQSGLADTSAFMQSSASYPNFDMLGENGALSVNEKYDNIPGLEGLKSSRLEQFEHDFLTSQANSQSKESNVLSHEGRIEQGFNSSGWPEKEPLPSMPNIASRREINSCVWCRNEFYHDIYEAGTQTGSVGFMCENCQGKFSGQVNFL
ncbi:hypothetical protein M0R45_027545 [Rubus argutus]|uniref:MBD domain-containing protein n=1 Tax=Rubus argutus TaxID=59490 RepID=A0AAW1X3F1_RUBAR